MVENLMRDRPLSNSLSNLTLCSQVLTVASKSLSTSLWMSFISFVSSAIAALKLTFFGSTAFILSVAIKARSPARMCPG